MKKLRLIYLLLTTLFITSCLGQEAGCNFSENNKNQSNKRKKFQKKRKHRKKSTHPEEQSQPAPSPDKNNPENPPGDGPQEGDDNPQDHNSQPWEQGLEEQLHEEIGRVIDNNNYKPQSNKINDPMPFISNASHNLTNARNNRKLFTIWRHTKASARLKQNLAQDKRIQKHLLEDSKYSDNSENKVDYSVNNRLTNNRSFLVEYLDEEKAQEIITSEIIIDTVNNSNLYNSKLFVKRCLAKNIDVKKILENNNKGKIILQHLHMDKYSSSPQSQEAQDYFKTLSNDKLKDFLDYILDNFGSNKLPSILSSLHSASDYKQDIEKLVFEIVYDSNKNFTDMKKAKLLALFQTLNLRPANNFTHTENLKQKLLLDQFEVALESKNLVKIRSLIGENTDIPETKKLLFQAMAPKFYTNDTVRILFQELRGQATSELEKHSLAQLLLTKGVESKVIYAMLRDAQDLLGISQDEIRQNNFGQNNDQTIDEYLVAHAISLYSKNGESPDKLEIFVNNIREIVQGIGLALFPSKFFLPNNNDFNRSQMADFINNKTKALIKAKLGKITSLNEEEKDILYRRALNLDDNTMLCRDIGALLQVTQNFEQEIMEIQKRFSALDRWDGVPDVFAPFTVQPNGFIQNSPSAMEKLVQMPVTNSGVKIITHSLHKLDRRSIYQNEKTYVIRPSYYNTNIKMREDDSAQWVKNKLSSANGQTPLLAILNSNKQPANIKDDPQALRKITKLFLDYGADIFAQDNSDNNIFSNNYKINSLEVLDLLLKYVGHNKTRVQQLADGFDNSNTWTDNNLIKKWIEGTFKSYSTYALNILPGKLNDENKRKNLITNKKIELLKLSLQSLQEDLNACVDKDVKLILERFGQFLGKLADSTSANSDDAKKLINHAKNYLNSNLTNFSSKKQAIIKSFADNYSAF